MKSKKLSVAALIVLFAFTVSVPSAWAGSPQKHRWEGVAIGVGAAILGKVLFDNHQSHRPVYGPAPQPTVIQHHHYQSPPPPAGHWETRREWVAPAYDNVWNPGHYDHRGRWVEGHWMRLQVQPGYWAEKEVWVPHY
jgi:hypothetical protein